MQGDGVRNGVMRRVNRMIGLAGASAAALGLFLTIPAELPDTSFGLPAWFMPAVALGLILLFSLLLLLQPGDGAERPSDEFGRAAGLVPSLLLALVGGFAVARFGFLLGGIPLIALLMLWLGERRPLRILIVAAGAPAVLEAFARYVIGISVP